MASLIWIMNKFNEKMNFAVEMFKNFWLKVSFSLIVLILFQQNFFAERAMLMKMFKIILMNKWFKLWFKFSRVMQNIIHCENFFITKFKSIVNSLSIQLTYVLMCLKMLKISSNSFIKINNFEVLKSLIALTLFHSTWYMLKSPIIKCWNDENELLMSKSFFFSGSSAVLTALYTNWWWVRYRYYEFENNDYLRMNYWRRCWCEFAKWLNHWKHNVFQCW